MRRTDGKDDPTKKVSCLVPFSDIFSAALQLLAYKYPRKFVRSRIHIYSQLLEAIECVLGACEVSLDFLLEDMTYTAWMRKVK